MKRSFQPQMHLKNTLQLYCNKNDTIFEYQISSMLPNSEYLQSLADYFKENGNVCLVQGNETLYLKKKLNDKVSTFKVRNLYSEEIEICLKFCRSIRIKHCAKFLNALIFEKIVDHLNDVGEPNVSCLNLSKLYNNSLVQGFWEGSVRMVSDNNEGLAVTMRVTHQITCQLPILDFIRREFIDNVEHDAIVERIKNKYIGKSVMTRYNNKIYKIDDIDFTSTPSSSFDTGDNDSDSNTKSFAEYYEDKYNIKVRTFNQPMIINRVEMTGMNIDGKKKSFVHCLIPEFCYPVYSEWNPIGADAFDEFIECIKTSPKAKEILQSWDLRLDPSYTYKRFSMTSSPVILYTKANMLTLDKSQPKMWKIKSMFSKSK